MTLSEELQWRGFVNQTTYKDLSILDGAPIRFYLGVDPTADSMQVGNLAIAMMVRHFIDYGHEAYLLVGGATGLIGDPDGKTAERELKPVEEIEHNKIGITTQYRQLFAGQNFKMVDNYDWFSDKGYLEFLREIGKHVPMRQMLGREFVQSRLSEGGQGISYAEFSYSLIQAYDFLYLHQHEGVSLQVCGADQWGNSIAGVDLIRRLTGDEAHVWSAPLIVNKTTGIKFGKSEAGAVWLDPAKTSPTEFYQFWVNVDDTGVEDYLKIYTLLGQAEIAEVMADQATDPKARPAQLKLAQAVTRLVHGDEAADFAARVSRFLVGAVPIAEADETELAEIRRQLPSARARAGGSIIEAMVQAGLVPSISEGRRLLAGNAISLNGQKIQREVFEETDFQNGRLLIKRGKAYRDSALIEAR